MEADGWDLHVSRTYMGIDGAVGEDRVMQAGGRVPDPSEPVAVQRSPESALLRQLRDEVRKRHYSRVLGITLDWLDGVVRAKRPKILPVSVSSNA